MADEQLPWLELKALRVPWLSMPSPQLASFAVVHRGPLAGGHLKLYLRATGDEAAGGGALYQVDVMKEASKVKDYDWGRATPLARADFAYPRSGT
eukprot:261851-Prymnesium_polylepis.1